MSKKCWLICGILAAMLGCLTLQAKTIPELCTAAGNGDADAQLELALCYKLYLCEKTDVVEKLIRKARESCDQTKAALKQFGE